MTPYVFIITFMSKSEPFGRKTTLDLLNIVESYWEKTQNQDIEHNDG